MDNHKIMRTVAASTKNASVDEIFKRLHRAAEQYRIQIQKRTRICKAYEGRFNQMPPETAEEFETCCDERDKYSLIIDRLTDSLKDAIKREVNAEFEKGVI